MRFLILLSSDCSSLNEVISAIKSQGNEVGVLLVQDGVFLMDKGCEHSSELAHLKVPVYASKSHIEERGISNRLALDVKVVDYPEIIDLIMENYDKTVSI
ncbi:MAG: sulfurtransferase complex subunit TusB [Candidatus Thorarchaeota archaeon]